jgi:hypothetical protein
MLELEIYALIRTKKAYLGTCCTGRSLLMAHGSIRVRDSTIRYRKASYTGRFGPNDVSFHA